MIFVYAEAFACQTPILGLLGDTSRLLCTPGGQKYSLWKPDVVIAC